MIGRVVAVVVCAGVIAACGSSGGTAACRNGDRLADIAIILDDRVPPDDQSVWMDRFRPGFDPVAGTTDYSFASAYPNGPDGTAIVYLYFDSPLNRRQRAQFRSKYADETIIRTIRFGVRPVGGFVPGGEC